MTRLSISNITFSFNKKDYLFDKLNLSISEGEIISIIGRSGLGKTTLLNLISGLLQAQSGDIYFNGENIQFPTKNVCYQKQNPTLLFHKRAIENALLNIELRKQLSGAKTAQAEDYFEKFGLKNASHQFPHKLSEGMKQRVAIIQTILSDSELYLFDEPFASIDFHYSQIIESNIWNKIKTNNKSSVIVNHDIEQAVAMSDKILLLTPDPKEAKLITLSGEITSLAPKTRRESSQFTHQLLKVMKCFSEN